MDNIHNYQLVEQLIRDARKDIQKATRLIIEIKRDIQVAAESPSRKIRKNK